MVKLLKHAGRCTGRYLVLAALTTTLVACGGSSGDSTTVDSQDLDNDGIPNDEDDDDDGDGILDSIDSFVDRDLDGFDDIIGDQDLDNDGILNKDDEDADGDGLLDNVEDTFVDLNADGLDDLTGLTETGPDDGFEEVTADNQCGVEEGSDNSSANANWDDNCYIQREGTFGNGQFADSLYAAGVQRVSWCAGFDGNTTASSYAAFADGEYGPSSETSMQRYQSDRGLVDDGIVGASTWAALQSEVSRIGDPGTFNAESVAYDAYGFAEGRCAGIILFYQEVSLNADGISTDLGGWELAKNQPNESQRIPFSIALPFGQLD